LDPPVLAIKNENKSILFFSFWFLFERKNCLIMTNSYDKTLQAFFKFLLPPWSSPSLPRKKKEAMLFH